MTSALDVLRAWPDIVPDTVIPMQQGDNNLTYRVTSPQGEFILQVMINLTAPDCLAANHRLLARLQDLDPGFAVPSPVPGTNGSTVVAMDGESPRSCVLTPVIPGSHPDGDEPGHLIASAMALGALHRALEAIPDPERYTCSRRVPSITANPGRASAVAGFSPAATSRLLDVIERAATIHARVSTSLPMQIVHADYYPSNVLIQGGKVSGVLDFEFAASGSRIYDVALGLWAFVLWDVWLGKNESAWSMVQPFLAAYASMVSLAPDEWRNLPHFIVIQEVHVFLHWCDRFIDGLASPAEMEIRAQRLLDMDRWVGHHHTKLDALIAATI